MAFAAFAVSADAQTRQRRAADRAQSTNCTPTSSAIAVVERITAQNDILLRDGRSIRLAGITMLSSVPLAPSARVIVQALGGEDRWGRLPALVAREGSIESIQTELISKRQALVRPEPNLGGCLTQLQSTEAASPQPFPALPREAGRFARLEGRVLRLREGRSAWFITLSDGDGRTTAVMVQKRHLARFKLADRDITTLANAAVRVRGTRHLRNPDLIALSEPDDIEIIRQ